MQLPEELLYGVDVAIKKLRPGANFQLEGTRFSYWDDPTGLEAPQWDEIKSQIDEDRKRAEKWLEAVKENSHE